MQLSTLYSDIQSTNSLGPCNDNTFASWSLSGCAVFGTALCGRRSSQEDVFSVSKLSEIDSRIPPDVIVINLFDGHGGSEASQFASQALPECLASALVSVDFDDVEAVARAMKRAFINTESQFFASTLPHDCGTTALCVLLTVKGIFVANAGDCCAYLASYDSGRLIYRQLCVQHAPSNMSEASRVIGLGFTVMEHEGSLRVNGDLSVTRSLGDRSYKPAITALPDVTFTPVTEKDLFIVIGCDGLWSLPPQSVIPGVASHLMSGTSPFSATHVVATAAAVQGDDNSSCIVVLFPGSLAALRQEGKRSTGACTVSGSSAGSYLEGDPSKWTPFDKERAVQWTEHLLSGALADSTDSPAERIAENSLAGSTD